MVEVDAMQDFIWESAKETFETMIFMPLEQAEQEAPLDLSAALICTITFTGPIQGVFAARTSSETAEKIARAMLMSELDDQLSENEICDALGEVTNMLLGGLKTRLNDTLPDIDISIPSIVKGMEVKPALGRDATKVSVNTKTDGQSLTIMLAHKNPA